MTLRIEKYSVGPSRTIRLIGRMQREHVEALKAQMKDSGPLALDEVSLVDLDVVCFLAICQREGVELLRCRRGSGWNLVGVVSGVLNPRDSSVGSLERRPRHD